jgi:hypothetical protein
MTLMYVFSFLGMLLAWIHYRKHRKPDPGEQKD